jgi:diguanylate cyclase (GGDEF)-like protein/PAS domain S-box-containing protein
VLRIIGCLTLDHDFRLVLLAAAVCTFGMLVSLAVSSRAVRGDHRNLWLALLALCAGSTVWATHFLAMLAYKTSVPMTYDPVLTAASFVLGVVVIGTGFAIALRNFGVARTAILGGTVVGAGVTILHYVGMAALQFPGLLRYEADLVIASVVLSSGFGAAAVYVATCWRNSYAWIAGAGLLIAMTVSLHFTGMGAVQLEYGPLTVYSLGGVSRTVLAIAVTVAAFTVLLIGMGGAIVEQRVSRRLAGEAERFRTLADGALEGLIVHRDGIVVDANAAARRMFGLPEPDGTLSIDHWFNGLDLGENRLRALKNDDPVEIALPRADGTRFPAEVCRRRMRLSDGGEGELLAIRDLTARKESEARFEHLALHDPLTDLPNRRLFMELASKSISHAHRAKERFAMLTVDLDGFKLVNDMHGHAAGDKLLKVVADRISATIRESDVFARFGGDEFAILQGSAAQPSHAMSLAERLLDVLSVPIRLSDAEVTVTASIGVALYPDDGAKVDDLLRNADTAMYRAKADGKATCRFFEAQMDAALETRRRLEARLRQAVVDEKLEVAFQPLVCSDGHEALGFEALVRWNDAELGSIPPADFIPVAEETGLIIPLGEFVLRRACYEAVKWSQPLRVAVNLSVMQFRRKGLIEMVRKALEDSGLPGERLELEVTESLLIDNRDDALRTLTALKELGVRIAMDDFGTGYSSLSYLQSFPFDKIKIDRAFVSDLEAESQNASIVRAVASMGKSLHMRVVAEGVETADQARLLKDLDCDELQGFLIARPMPAAKIEEFLEANHKVSMAPVQLNPELRRAASR